MAEIRLVKMIWQEVKLYLLGASSVGAEMLAAELLRLGVAGWQQQSASELRNYLQDESSPFDYAAAELQSAAEAADDTVAFTLYLADDEQGAQILAALQRLAAAPETLGLQSLRVQVNRRSSEEWEDNWKQYYKPFKVGSRLVVCPCWEEYAPQAGELLLRIEPGGSFGTGQHQTTRLCLELLESCLAEQPAGAKLLDLGCGTGILSIGGLLLGAKSAVAVDIEEHSAKAAAENAALNELPPERYLTLWGNILTDEALLAQVRACAPASGYDIIVVNIVADVIMAMSPLFAQLLAGQGQVICSGIIENRRAEVLQTLQALGLRLQAERQDGGWCSMLFAL